MTAATEMHVVMEAKGKAKGRVPEGLTPEDLKAMYRAMLFTRHFDKRGMNLQRQGRIGFFVPSMGQEASQIGAGYAMGQGDFLYPSYRTHSLALLKGVSLRTLYDQMWGNANDLVKGRQMPNHFAIPDINWVSISSPIGTQISQAAGSARAMQIRGDPDKAVWVWFGDGGTSSNDFHAGLNFAGVWKAPTIFMCENNHWAISVPQERQTASVSFADKAVAYGMHGVRVDGNDVLAVYEAAKEARDRAVRGGRADPDRDGHVPHGTPLLVGRPHPLPAQGTLRVLAEEGPHRSLPGVVEEQEALERRVAEGDGRRDAGRNRVSG